MQEEPSLSHTVCIAYKVLLYHLILSVLQSWSLYVRYFLHWVHASNIALRRANVVPVTEISQCRTSGRSQPGLQWMEPGLAKVWYRARSVGSACVTSYVHVPWKGHGHFASFILPAQKWAWLRLVFEWTIVPEGSEETGSGHSAYPEALP